MTKYLLKYDTKCRMVMKQGSLYVFGFLVCEKITFQRVLKAFIHAAVKWSSVKDRPS